MPVDKNRQVKGARNICNVFIEEASKIEDTEQLFTNLLEPFFNPIFNKEVEEYKNGIYIPLGNFVYMLMKYTPNFMLDAPLSVNEDTEWMLMGVDFNQFSKHWEDITTEEERNLRCNLPYKAVKGVIHEFCD